MSGRALGLALGLLVAARILYAGALDLAEDEAYYWVWSRHLAAGYFDHPPAVAWMIRAGTLLLGDTERGVRLGALVLGGLSALLAAGLARDRALVVAALCTMPLLALGGLLATPDVPLVLCWTAGLVFAASDRWGWVGVAAGLAMLSKYTGLLLLPLLVLGRPAALRTRGPYLAAAVAFLVYLPNALWNLRHDYISWHFQLDHVREPVSRLGFALAQLGLAGPVLGLAFVAWWAVAWRGDAIERLCWWSSLPLMVLAIWIGGEANWAAPALVGPAIGLARRGGAWARAAWVGVGVSGALSVLVAVHAVHPLVTLPTDPTDRLRGGRTLGSSVAAWGVPAVYTSRYQEAALIEFYGGVPAIALPGAGRPDQYDLWFSELAPHALYVRPWRGGAPMAMLDLGYDTPGPSTVTAYANTADPLVPRLVARWQVFEVFRGDGAPNAPDQDL